MNEVNKPKKPMIYYYAIVLLVMMLVNLFMIPAIHRAEVKEVDYGTFMKATEAQQIKEVEIDTTQNQIIYTLNDDEDQIYKTGLMDDPGLTERLYSSGAVFKTEIHEQASPLVSFLLTWVLPVVFFYAIGQLLMRRYMNKEGGGSSLMFNMGKSNARVYIKSTTGILFKDVAGEDEAKESLQEIVTYLHDPARYTEIGASMPKGILLVGPPGTGKTMLAKAVAGESNVPFFSISGSEFVEMFVGMGASKVRDLFRQAKEKAPCIVFIDEIDAIGGKRAGGNLGGNDEREQTLNQLLTEMDGFESNNGVVILAATNRPENLDPALLRPGRFDRKVGVGRPDVQGREDILKVHANDKPLSDDVDLKQIARTTAGFTGADLENLMNEAAIGAARRGSEYICQRDIKESFIKVGIGAEKKSKVISDKEKRITAYHEAGHAILFHVLPDMESVYTISIIPTGMGAAGYTMPLPENDEMFMTRGKMLQEITTLLGGRVAEEIIFEDITTGASNDIKRATGIARSMVMKYGMSENLGLVVYGDDDDEVFIGRDLAHAKGYSEEAARAIDEEVRAIISECHEKAFSLIKEHSGVLHSCAELLLEKEKIHRDEFEELFRIEQVQMA